jgi:hypothetical protein
MLSLLMASMAGYGHGMADWLVKDKGHLFIFKDILSSNVKSPVE